MAIARSTPAQKPRGLARRTSMFSAGNCATTRAPILRFPFRLSRFTLPEQAVPDQQPRTDGDRGIGDVEGGPVIPVRVEQDEVDDVAEGDAIPKVAERTAEDQREAGSEKTLLRVAAQEVHDQGRGGERDRDENAALPAAGAGQEAERGASVKDEHEVEERQDVDARPRLQAGLDDHLRRLVERRNDDRKQQPWRELSNAGRRGAAHANRRVSPAPSRFDTQRPQSTGCAACAPTSAR